MNANGYDSIPHELFYWITFLTRALPSRSAGTFIELLIGAMLTPTGFVTDAWLMLDMRNHWTSYYKWLQRGRWSWLALSRQFLRLLLGLIHQDVIYLAVDDTLTLRSSKKAPGSRMHHQHGNKPNLANYVLGQCWVYLAMIVPRGSAGNMALPLLARLMPGDGHTGKLIAANTLIRGVYQLLAGLKVRVLADSWFMKRCFIDSMLSRGFEVIGQVRIDTRLYDRPSEKKNPHRGRPRKYGDQYSKERVAGLRRTQVSLTLYGKKQDVRFYSNILMARFLGGKLVRAVWCELKSNQGEWKAPRLFIGTDTSMSAEDILQSYGMRWSIESLFNQLKLIWGLKAAWQQTRQTLNRWVHLTMVGYGLVQLLSCINSPGVDELCLHSPWRKAGIKTAGNIRKGLVKLFMHVRVRDWWDPKCKKFTPPDQERRSDYGCG